MLRSGRIICDRACKVDWPGKSVGRRHRECSSVACGRARCKRHRTRRRHGEHVQHRDGQNKAAGGICGISAVAHVHKHRARTPIAGPKVKAAGPIRQCAASAVASAGPISIQADISGRSRLSDDAGDTGRHSQVLGRKERGRIRAGSKNARLLLRHGELYCIGGGSLVIRIAAILRGDGVRSHRQVRHVQDRRGIDVGVG